MISFNLSASINQPRYDVLHIILLITVISLVYEPIILYFINNNMS